MAGKSGWIPDNFDYVVISGMTGVGGCIASPKFQVFSVVSVNSVVKNIAVIATDLYPAYRCPLCPLW